MIVNLYKGYPDRIGRRLVFAGWGAGPTSYSQTTGDVIQNFAFQNYIDSVQVSPSVSGTYYARAVPSGKGPRQTWAIHYYATSGNAEVGNATNLSAESFVVSGLGGVF